ncbi:MAG TPA: GNAT family N-acetyltransferase [Anaeromyxobacter sp.]|nr:GNAT family N-acetyltransferase [Anaeromyxobacter sp.]
MELFASPLAPERWETYERVSRSYGCTREFIEYFERPAAPALALVRRRGDGQARAAFLFTQDSATVRVHGRFSAPSAEAVAAFAEAIFSRYPNARRIGTGLIDALPDPGAVRRPTLAVHEATELRIALPATLAEYERTLSQDFVRRCRHDERRVARELPAARFETREGPDIPPWWISEVVRLNRDRMAAKNGRSVFSREYEEGISRVARRHGCVTVLHDGARVYAGVVDIRCGTDVFGWVIGHDDAFGKLGPGRLVQLAATRHCIARGYRTIHLLHGQSSYKQAVGGRVAELAEYVVLRSWSALRPRDLVRVAGNEGARFARRSVDRADEFARRALGRRGAPVRSLLQSLVRTARRATAG